MAMSFVATVSASIADGKQLWGSATRFFSQVPDFIVWGSGLPTPDKSAVIVPASNNSINRINGATGAIEWSHRVHFMTDGSGYGAPADGMWMVTPNGIVVATCSRHLNMFCVPKENISLISLDIATGKKRWSADIPLVTPVKLADPGEPIEHAPSVCNLPTLAYAPEAGVVAISCASLGTSNKKSLVSAIDPSDGRLLWSSSAHDLGIDGVEDIEVVGKGASATVLLEDTSGGVTVFEGNTGKVRWTARLNETLPDYWAGSFPGTLVSETFVTIKNTAAGSFIIGLLAAGGSQQWELPWDGPTAPPYLTFAAGCDVNCSLPCDSVVGLFANGTDTCVMSYGAIDVATGKTTIPASHVLPACSVFDLQAHDGKRLCTVGTPAQPVSYVLNVSTGNLAARACGSAGPPLWVASLGSNATSVRSLTDLSQRVVIASGFRGYQGPSKPHPFGLEGLYFEGAFGSSTTDYL